MTTIDLEAVARIFNEAIKDGDPPTKSVKEELGLTMSTASNWVRRAKDRGLIPDQNFAGKQKNEKIEAIAADLGITPERLSESIRKHAGGDLRISLDRRVR